MKRKFRLLKPSEIKCLVSRSSADTENQNYWGSLILYADTRTIYDILDDTVGPDNWKVEHYQVKNKDFARISIWDKDKGQWIDKSDCGSETFIEAEKGESSDAVKRAAVAWGLTRELYLRDGAEIYVDLTADDFRKDEMGEFRLRPSVRNEFTVEDVTYEDGRIRKISIKRAEKLFTKDFSSTSVRDEEKKAEDACAPSAADTAGEIPPVPQMSEDEKRQDILSRLSDLGVTAQMVSKKYGIPDIAKAPVPVLEQALKSANERALKIRLIDEIKKKLKISSAQLAERLQVKQVADASQEMLAEYLKSIQIEN